MAFFPIRKPRFTTLDSAKMAGRYCTFRSHRIDMWIFSAPTDSPSGCAGEARLCAICGLYHICRSCWGCAKAVHLLRNSDGKWASLFKGEHVRILPPDQMFASNAYPRQVVWISGAVALHPIGGVFWMDREFFVLASQPLIRKSKRVESEEAIIGECDISVTIIIALAWGFSGWRRNAPHPQLAYRQSRCLLTVT